jgi:hypothetical protein
MTQEQMILAHLESGKSITKAEAFYEYGMTKADTVISRLRRKGYPIEGTMKKGKNRFGKEVSYTVYRLISKDNTDK